MLENDLQRMVLLERRALLCRTGTWWITGQARVEDLPPRPRCGQDRRGRILPALGSWETRLFKCKFSFDFTGWQHRWENQHNHWAFFKMCFVGALSVTLPSLYKLADQPEQFASI